MLDDDLDERALIPIQMRPASLASIGQIRLANNPVSDLYREALSHPTAEHREHYPGRRFPLR